MFRADDRQAIGTVQFLDGGLEGDGQVHQVLELVVEQMGDDFGVGVRGEHIAERLELFTQGFVVFDDAVVHHRQVAGKMRVSVTLARRAMGGPTRVGDAQATEQRFGFQRLRKLADLARTTHAFELLVVGKHRHTGAVITAVFQALEAFEQDCCDVAFSNGADNSTHAISPG